MRTGGEGRDGATIGIVDSGPDSSRVALAVSALLPDDRVRWAGDTGRWGNMPVADVRRRALCAADTLVAGGVGMLVIASPTATAVCLADARERYGIPVIGALSPTVRRALRLSTTARIGVLATHAAVTSGAFGDAFAVCPGVEVTCVPCTSSASGSEDADARSAAERLRLADVDTVVLGCAAAIGARGHLGPGVRLLSMDRETALEAVRTRARVLPAAAARPGRFVPA